MDIPQLKEFGSFEGRTCLITGGASGIGLTLGLQLHSIGAKVLICDLNPPHPSNTGLPKDSKRWAYTQCDVTSYASQLAAFRYCASTFGSWPDVVYGNAGIGEKGTWLSVAKELDEDIDQEPAHDVINVDLIAVANTTRLAWYGMRKEKRNGGLKFGGSIILTASMAGYAGQPGLTVYNAAKHGVVGLVRSARYFGPSQNIAISLVAPTITNTPLLNSTQLPGFGESVDSSETPNQLAQRATEAFEGAGVPVNTADQVARVMIELAAKGMKANGAGILVQAGLKWDLEEGISRTRKAWMGERMAHYYKGGKDSDFGIGGVGARVPGEKSKL